MPIMNKCKDCLRFVKTYEPLGYCKQCGADVDGDELACQTWFVPRRRDRDENEEN